MATVEGVEAGEEESGTILSGDGADMKEAASVSPAVLGEGASQSSESLVAWESALGDRMAI